MEGFVMNQFQQDLQSLNLNDYQSGNVVYWDQLQQNQYPYYYIQEEARRCGGCGGCGGGRCVGCAGCFGCFNCWNWWII
ncbi:TPA: heterocycloanthracin/sonorensin family bacteriocin [Bacillus mobilis]